MKKLIPLLLLSLFLVACDNFVSESEDPTYTVEIGKVCTGFKDEYEVADGSYWEGSYVLNAYDAMTSECGSMLETSERGLDAHTASNRLADLFENNASVGNAIIDAVNNTGATLAFYYAVDDYMRYILVDEEYDGIALRKSGAVPSKEELIGTKR